MPIKTALRRLKLLSAGNGDSGQTLTEYGLLIALLAIASIVGLSVLAGGVDTLWGWIGDEIVTAVDKVLE